MTLKSTYPEEVKGEAMPRVATCTSMPLGQLAHGVLRKWARRTSNFISDNVKMQGVIRQQRQAVHEVQQEGPSCVKPVLLRTLPQDDAKHAALCE